MSNITLLFLVVHINFYIGGNGCGDRRRRGLRQRGRNVMQRISIYVYRYTVDAVLHGVKRPVVAVDGVVGTVEDGVTRSVRVAHDYA